MILKKMALKLSIFFAISLTMVGVLSASQIVVEEGGQHVSTSVSTQPTVTEKARYSVNENIIAMFTLFDQSPAQSEKKWLAYKAQFVNANVAEQYLLLLLQAKIKQISNQNILVVELLEQAKLLAEKIDEQQLSSPLFNELFQVLAKSYEALNDFEQAYQAKKSYIDYFYDYSDAVKDKTIASLTQKYEIAHKTKANELLDQQNKFKAFKLGDVQKQQANQQRNFILIFCSILVFILLFLRQFKLRKKLQILAKTDSLTGLLNRSALFNSGRRLLKKTVENNKNLTALLFDIDHFKRVNDEYGHHIGDLVLVKVASLVSETMRSRDIFARLGGEEFVILLPDTDIDKAKAIAMRVIEKVAQHNFKPMGLNRPITLSIGVANIKDTAAVFDDMLHAADLAMYQAKIRGRNQLVNYATISDAQERRANTNPHN